MKFTEEQIRESQIKSVARMMSLGVTGIKVELEADFSRVNDEDENNYCDYCEEGRIDCEDCSCGDRTCETCDGDGINGTITQEDGSHPDCETCEGRGEVTCESCMGSGYTDCEHCDGNGVYDSSEGSEEYSSETNCLAYILSQLNVEETSGISGHENLEGVYVENPTDWLRYINFYNDHSVDSECTFTVRLKTPEDVYRVLDVMKAFTALGDEIGNGIQVGGAGMHMSLIFDQDCTYPSERILSQQQVRNFRDSMKTLLPALYFLGTSNDQTRSMTYRTPNVSIGDTDNSGFGSGQKYSAIHYVGGAIEFRIFDTCYNKPENIIDNVVVMGKCLEYIQPRRKVTSVVKDVQEFTFGNDNGRELTRLYYNATHIHLLNAGLSRIKPEYKTIRELKKERGFKVSERSLVKKESEAREDAERRYAEYEERFNTAIKFREKEMRFRYIRQAIDNMSHDDIESQIDIETLEIKDESLRSRIEEYTANYLIEVKRERTDKSRYIRNHLSSVLGCRDQYSLRVVA